MARLGPQLKPLVEQAWLNMCVWIPVLANPHRRSCQVKYWGRECRDGLKWTLELPQQCYKCGSTESLKGRGFNHEVRGFEYPLGIVMGTLTVAATLLLIGWLFWSLKFFILGLVALPVGLGVLMVKSWKDLVQVVMYGCEEHLDEMRCPEMAVFENQLFLPRMPWGP